MTISIVFALHSAACGPLVLGGDGESGRVIDVRPTDLTRGDFDSGVARLVDDGAFERGTWILASWPALPPRPRPTWLDIDPGAAF